MKCYSLSHLADQTLLHDLAALLKQDRATTAALLAYLAEVDERKLYRPAAYPSMYLYCVHELRMSADTAFMRIRAARTARQFPAIFPALADGRLNLTAVVLLAPYLTLETAGELLTAAAQMTKEEIRLLIARRFPQPDVPTVMQALAPVVAASEPAAGPVEPQAPQLVPERVGMLASGSLVARLVEVPALQLVPEPVVGIIESSPAQPAPEPVLPSGPREMSLPLASIASRAKLAPLAPGRFAWQLTVDQETQDLLRYAQALLGHTLPSGDVAAVLKRALGSMVRELERQKFARSAQSRLRCRAHNQYTAECTFGAVFMQGKREEARSRAVHARAQAGAEKCARAQADARARAEERARAQAQAEAAAESASKLDVVPWLRKLGFSAEEARRGAARCAHIPDAALDQRVRFALRGLAPNCVRRAAPVASMPS